MSDAAVVRVSQDGAVRVTISRIRAAFCRAGVESIASGTDLVDVGFTTNIGTTGYIPVCTVGNLTDNPDLSQNIFAKITSIRASGFSVKLSAVTLTANYKLYWGIAESFNP